MFKSGECVHFVFADRSERYFCSSALILSLEKYLYLQLRKAGYRDVYFLRQKDIEWTLEFSENEKKFFEKSVSAGIFKKADIPPVENVVRELTDILYGNKPYRKKGTAVVADLASFVELGESVSEKTLNGLIEAASSPLRENILVLCSSNDCGDSYSALFETKAFQTCVKNRYLSVPVAGVKRNEPNPFDQLWRQCRYNGSGNYLVLNSKVTDEQDDLLVNEQLKALADCLLFRHKAWQLPEEPYLVPFLYIVMRSETMRKKLKISQPKFSELYDRLSREDVWKTFLGYLNLYLNLWREEMSEKGRLIAYMREILCDFDEIAGGVCVRDDISGACGDTDLPEWYSRMCRENPTSAYTTMCESLAEIRRNMLTPRWSTNPTAADYFLKYMQFFRMEKKNSLDSSGTHLKSAVSAAAFAVKYLGHETVSDEFCRCCSAYEDMLQTEQNYYTRCKQRMQSQDLGQSALTSSEDHVQQEQDRLEKARLYLKNALETLERSDTPAAIRKEEQRAMLEGIFAD